MRLILPQKPLPIQAPKQIEPQDIRDPCRCDDDLVDWRKLLRGI